MNLDEFSDLLGPMVRSAASVVALALAEDGAIEWSNAAGEALLGSDGAGRRSGPVAIAPEALIRASRGVVETEVGVTGRDGREVLLAAWIAGGPSGYRLLGEVRDIESDEVVARISRINEKLADDARELRREKAELERTAEAMGDLADTDPLTGLANRRGWADRTGALMSGAQRRGEAVAVVMLDIDHFKRINDEHGHPTGDRVLEWVGELIGRECREDDVAGRYGGEEFAVAVAGSGRESARAFADRLRRRIADDSRSRGPLRITVSAGVAEVDTDLDEAVARADRALYRAKRRGRDRVIVAERQSEGSRR